MVRVLAVAALLTLAGPASAHKLLVVAKPDPLGVRVEAGYDDETPADDATVTLSNNGGTGKTDAKGVLVLPRPAPGEYEVTVDDGAGHRGTARLTVPDGAAELAAATEARRNKWLMIGAGLAIIAAGTLVARRRRPPPPATS